MGNKPFCGSGIVTRALDTCATKSQCWDILYLVFVVEMAFLCMFLLHFDDEHHHGVFDTAQLTEGHIQAATSKKKKHFDIQLGCS